MKAKVSPMQRSLKMLKSQGYVTTITEHFNMFAKIRQDLWGFADIICLKKGKMLAVQTTTAENILARKKKIEENKNYSLLKTTGCKIQVHGWKKKDNKWGCKIIKL